MSSTGRNRLVRHRYDSYPTPSWSVRRLLDAWVPLSIHKSHWLEPCAGDGAIIKAVPHEGVIWTAVELQRNMLLPLSKLTPNVYINDFLGFADSYRRCIDRGWREPFDVAITNPPYSLAREFITACKQISREVAMLLRLNFLGSEARADWLREDPPDIYVLPNRISGTGDGKTDSTEYAWFIWRVGRDFSLNGMYDILPTTPLEERRRDYR